MKSYVILFGLVIVVILGCLCLGMLFIFLLHSMYTISGVSSVFLCVAFVVAMTILCPQTMNELAIGVCLISILGMLLDPLGNAIFNIPLKAFFSIWGEIEIETHIFQIPGETSIGYTLMLSHSDGTTTTIPSLILYMYRLIQYWICYTVLGLILKKFLPAQKIRANNPK